MKRFIFLALAALAPFLITGCMTDRRRAHTTWWLTSRTTLGCPGGCVDFQAAGVCDGRGPLPDGRGLQCGRAGEADADAGIFISRRRSRTSGRARYGFSISGGVVTPMRRGSSATAAMWDTRCRSGAGLPPAYGFHQGYVWPVPRTHGCIRLDKQVAPRFYELVHVGTPVDIAETQPRGRDGGPHVARPSGLPRSGSGAVVT